MAERVQKILSQWGIASRRQAEDMIAGGRVRLNGAIAQLGQKADPALDCLEVDGAIVRPSHRPQHFYLLLHKPVGYVSTCQDPQNRRTVLDLLPSAWRQGQGIHPVGRLDFDSSGALLLTNDGDLTFQLTHPRHHISKIYHVTVDGRPTRAVLDQWRQGILLDERQTLPARVKILLGAAAHQTTLEVVLREGRNRQIRRVAEQLGHPVRELHRVQIGPIALNLAGTLPLPPGAYRLLTDLEVSSLKAHLPLPSEKVPVPEECYP
jgi:23S rRNA pseudouridine2605 synthase